MAEEKTTIKKRSSSRGNTLPKKIGGYQPTQMIGHGAMGNVWLCYDPSLDRMVVVKQMQQTLLNQDDFILRFQREAKILAHLNHPAIIQPYALWKESDGKLSLSMEFVEGKSLRELLDCCKRPPVWVVMAVLYEILSALAEVHRYGIVHRDLKPANMMIDKDGRVRLLDFGVAHAEKENEDDLTLTMAGSQIGTGAYMSPEQTLNEDATSASDLFSMGIVASEMLLGENFFRGENLSQTFKKIQKLKISLDAFSKDVPKPLSKLVIKLLAKNPRKRPLSAADAADELSKIMKSYPRHIEPYLAEWVLSILDKSDTVINPIVNPDNKKKLFFIGIGLGIFIASAISILIHFI